LEVVKEAFRLFILGEGESAGGREGDLIGMVTFARYADGVSPLTLDHDMLLSLLDQVEIVTQPEDNGTSIGEAMALAVERLRENAATSKVMILLTDGSNNAGLTEPLEAAQIAKALGIKIYTIGTGSRGTAPVPMRTHDGRQVVQRMQVSIDEGTLRQIARLTGGKYFRATDSEALKEIYAEIDRLEKTTTVAQHYQQYVDFFPIFLLAGLGLVLLETVLVNTRLRTVP
jgi:Ca-activated chloride channel family protein